MRVFSGQEGGGLGAYREYSVPGARFLVAGDFDRSGRVDFGVVTDGPALSLVRGR